MLRNPTVKPIPDKRAPPVPSMKNGKRFVDFLKSFDVFKESVSLTYKGDNSFSTLPGSIISLFAIATILTFAFFKGIRFL